VVIHNFHVVRSVRFPPRTDAKLVINPYAVLAFAVSHQRFQPIAGGIFKSSSLSTMSSWVSLRTVIRESDENFRVRPVSNNRCVSLSAKDRIKLPWYNATRHTANRPIGGDFMISPIRGERRLELAGAVLPARSWAAKISWNVVNPGRLRPIRGHRRKCWAVAPVEVVASHPGERSPSSPRWTRRRRGGLGRCHQGFPMCISARIVL